MCPFDYHLNHHCRHHHHYNHHHNKNVPNVLTDWKKVIMTLQIRIRYPNRYEHTDRLCNLVVWIIQIRYQLHQVVVLNCFILVFHFRWHWHTFYTNTLLATLYKTNNLFIILNFFILEVRLVSVQIQRDKETFSMITFHL